MVFLKMDDLSSCWGFWKGWHLRQQTTCFIINCLKKGWQDFFNVRYIYIYVKKKGGEITFNNFKLAECKKLVQNKTSE